MGANIRWLVTVIKPTEVVVEIDAVTAEEAKDKARELPGVVFVGDAVDEAECWEGDQ